MDGLEGGGVLTEQEDHVQNVGPLNRKESGKEGRKGRAEQRRG